MLSRSPMLALLFLTPRPTLFPSMSRFLGEPEAVSTLYAGRVHIQTISQLTQVVEEIRALLSCPFEERYYAVLLDEAFLSILESTPLRT